MDLMDVKRGGWPFLGPPNCDFELNTRSPQAEGLVAWWPTIGSRGANVLRDYGPRGLHGDLQGGSGWTNDGRLGSVVTGDGADGVVDITGSAAAGHALDFTGGPYAFSFWFYAVGSSGTLIGKRTTAACQFQIYYNNNVIFRIADQQALSSSGYAQNAWHHVVYSMDASRNYRFVINGNADGTGTHTGLGGHFDIPVSLLARWGVYPATEYELSGRMADVRIYDRHLSIAEAKEHSNPATRWELYRPMVRWWVGYAAAGGGAIDQIATVSWASVGQFAGVAEASIAEVAGVAAN